MPKFVVEFSEDSLKELWPKNVHTWTGRKGESQPITTISSANLRGILRTLENGGVAEKCSGIYNAIRQELATRRASL